MPSPDDVDTNGRPPVAEVAYLGQRPPAWDTLAGALAEQRTVSVCYHGHERVVCPHVLGWSKRRAKVLVYQVAGSTSAGVLPGAPERRWRSMFVEEIEDAAVIDWPWQSAWNYSDDPARSGMEVVALRALATAATSAAGGCQRG